MAKTIEDVRAETLRLLKRLSPDDPRYIRDWMKDFDQQHGIKTADLPAARRKRRTALPKPAASRGRIK
jgi:hypothetical protein